MLDGGAYLLRHAERVVRLRRPNDQAVDRIVAVATAD
jgi:hypothetical protein